MNKIDVTKIIATYRTDLQLQLQLDGEPFEVDGESQHEVFFTSKHGRIVNENTIQFENNSPCSVEIPDGLVLALITPSGEVVLTKNVNYYYPTVLGEGDSFAFCKGAIEFIFEFGDE